MKERGWEIRAKRKGEVATDILGQIFYFLMFIQYIKNKFKTACRKASQTSGIVLKEKSILKKDVSSF